MFAFPSFVVRNLCNHKYRQNIIILTTTTILKYIYATAIEYHTKIYSLEFHST